MKIPLKKLTWIYTLTIILLSIVILALIYFVPTKSPLKYLIIKLVKPFVWVNNIILIILLVLRIKCYFTKHKKRP